MLIVMGWEVLQLSFFSKLAPTGGAVVDGQRRTPNRGRRRAVGTLGVDQVNVFLPSQHHAKGESKKMGFTE